ncbi:COX assembly mitochondrial protein 2 homolog [Diaphorina citri]|uniref:COX assembly mitochondrial protein n=1 Tax=Diaphorina citri TaxID=121845 RepID=A0A1S3D598_DIACI|nr:COX assembly mitochondrial protein 2 homolog [Diaphorina citri]KAI5703802.1 hypothetical protein M8J75_016385 [Diaphorina citri]KAI5733178.1 hypothetical protein M8J76_008616 [Diaphorina citri]KAI5737913.1 hypothetical protein M8J77_000699 [Diaphorina citri]
MHPDLAEHLHTDKCNEFIHQLKECQKNFWTSVTGGCGQFYVQVNSCLHDERILRRAKNFELSQERKRRSLEKATQQEKQ